MFKDNTEVMKISGKAVHCIDIALVEGSENSINKMLLNLVKGNL